MDESTEMVKSFLQRFYLAEKTRVALNKRERDKIWHAFKKNRSSDILKMIGNLSVLEIELRKYLENGKLVQSAIFSECVYSEALSRMFSLDRVYSLDDFKSENSEIVSSAFNGIPSKVRYVYFNEQKNLFLLQAGGHRGVDLYLVQEGSPNFVSIEFKEPLAKTSEPDLPRYGEDGFLVVDEKWLNKNPQFSAMIDEQLEKRLNFFEAAGTNIHDFSIQSIRNAVSENYRGEKFADYICTEDSSGFLVLIPGNEAAKWATVKGEIRPAGRNLYKVWTTKALEVAIEKCGGSVNGEEVRVELGMLAQAARRGGNGETHRLKISPLFFVYKSDTVSDGDYVVFNKSDVRQLKPTISAHMNFEDIKFEDLQNRYLKVNPIG